MLGRLDLDRSTISNLIRLLDLPEEVRDAVMAKTISQGHARALLGLTDPEAILAGFRQVVTEGLNVRQTEALVATGVPTESKSRIRKDPGEAGSSKAPHFLELEDHLKSRLGTSVLVKTRGKGRGQIVIDYNSAEEFDRVSEIIRGS